MMEVLRPLKSSTILAIRAGDLGKQQGGRMDKSPIESVQYNFFYTSVKHYTFQKYKGYCILVCRIEGPGILLNYTSIMSRLSF